MNRQIKKAFFLLLVVVSSFNVAHSRERRLQKKVGTVSFITPQNIYLRFGNTDGIAVGDTIFFESRGKLVPAVAVKYMSTQSCAGEKIGNLELKVGDKMFALIKVEASKAPTQKMTGVKLDTNSVQTNASPQVEENFVQTPLSSPRFYGGVSASSYSNFSNYTGSSNIQRWNYSVSLNAENIAGTSVYFSNYMNFSYVNSEWQDVKSSLFNNLRIYDLTLGYKGSGFDFWFGRHINNHISDVGPVDGLQMEKHFGSYSVGGVVGSRPDFGDMAFNSKLFEFGGYLSRTDTLSSGLMENTVAVFQQNNDMRTDRRFIYFQHNSNLFDNLNFFISIEADLFKLQNNLPKSDFSLTSLFFSTQYYPVGNLSFNLSYDARKNVIYYQTFGSLLDSLFQNELRQGLRMRINWRPFSGMFVNLGAGYSFQKGDVKPSRNINISITQTEIPLLMISGTVSYNRILSNYLDGSIYGIRFSKYLPFNFTTVSAGYSRINYSFGNGGNNLIQNIATVEASTRIFDRLFFNLYYEGIFSNKTTYGSLIGGLNFRF